MHDKTRELYKEAHQMLEKAKLALEKEGELTDAQRQEIEQWQAQAAQIEKRAEHLEATLAKHLEMTEALQADKMAMEKRAAEKKTAVEFKHGGEYLVALHNYYVKRVEDPRLPLLVPEYKDLAGEVGISGGYLLPVQQQQEILTVMGEQSFIRGRATVIPMGARMVNWPALDHSLGAAGVHAFSGGIRVYWTEENTAITESQPRFKNVELHARELAAYTEVPNGLLRDSAVSLSAFFSGENGFGGALGAELDYQAINGTGAGKPLGVLNSPAKLTVTRNAATNFKFVDAVTMLSKMIMSGKPVWLINQAVMPKLLQFADAANFNIFVTDAAVGPKATLLGLPIIWTGKCPALGTQGDVILCDWSQYLLGDRQVMTMDVDASFKFQQNQTAFRALIAVDGQPWLANTITLMDGATTVSPYVVLN